MYMLYNFPDHFSGAIATHNFLREYNLPIGIYDVNCTGSELRIADCPHNALNVKNCNHGQDASVVCQTIDGMQVVK